MGKQRSSCDATSRRAWRLLRLALLWARKGGLLKCRLMAELRLVPKFLKGLNKHSVGSRDMIRYGERELSFDNTPIIHLRMSRPASLRFMIPCIKPHVTDFDYDFGDDHDDDVGYGSYGCRGTFLENKEVDYREHDDDDDDDDDNGDYCEDDQGIDMKAEEFISNFYQQMKLQRQISYQQRHHH